MATVKIEQFCGIAPRTHPTLLADGMAVTAHNCRLKNGKLVPLKQPLLVRDVSLLMESSYLDGSLVSLTNVANAKSIHAWKETDGSIELMLFPGVTWMSEGNIADDERTRVVVSGDTGADFEDSDGNVTHNTPVIYMRDQTSRSKIVHPLCKNPLPAPKVSRDGGDVVNDVEIVSKGYKTVAQINALTSSSLTKGWTYVSTDAGDITLGPSGTLSVVADTSVTWGGSNWVLTSEANLTTNIRYTYFFITWVDRYGYESPVSPQSKILENGSWVDGDLKYLDGDTVKIEALGSGNIPSEAVKIRVYKVVTGTEEGRIQFVKETSATGMDVNPFKFTVKDEDTGEVLTEIEAPFSDMRCILDVPGAYYCGFAPSHPKTVCFSEVDLLYSWPVAYQYDVKDNIVALAVTSNTVFALTDGWPYVLTGTDPSGMTVTKLAGPASCVSARGVCVFKNAVYYVGQQGLMTIYNDADEGTVCKNLTDKIFTKEQWQAFNPSSCVMGQFDGAILLFFTSSDGTTHTGLTIDLTESACAVTTHDEVAKCVCTDNRTDKMYYVREGV